MVTTKRPGRWIKTLGLFTASVLLLTSLTFTTRAYIIENIVSILLDREIIIDDIVDIETGLLFSATLSGVYMDHSDARFQAEAMFIEMNIIQWLSSDEINLTQLLISNAELHIKEIEEQGQEKEEDAETRSDLIPKEFAFLNMKISYSDEDQDWLAQVASCTGKGHSNSNIAGLTCSGELNGTPFNIMGNYGLPDTEQTTEPLNISVDWGDFSLTAKGKLDSLLDLAGARLDITLSSAHPGPLLRLLGIHELREGAININARIENQTAGEPYEFHIDGSVAGLNVRVDGNTQDIQTLDPIEASFMVSGPSLYEAGALFNELRLTAAPFLASGEFSFSGSSLDIPALNIQLEQGTIEISATAPALPDTEGLQLTITANQFKPNFLKPLAETCELTAEPMDVDAEITLMDNGQRVVIETRSATLQLKAQGTINESPGDINLTVVAESTTMAAIGQCFDVKLPDQPGRASTIVTKKGNLIALSKLRFDSDVAEISGLANIQLVPELSFDTTLHINVPNARNLADGLLENPGSVRAFPFESSLSVHGSEKLLELDDFAISSGKHTGRASGSIGEAFTWHGLDLELTLSGQDLRHLFTDAERKVSQVKPYSLSTTLKNQQGTWVIEQLHASVENSTVNLSARISNEPQYVGSALQVSAEGKNIENLIGHWVDYPLPSLPFSGSADVELTDEYLHFQSLKIIVGEHELTGTLFVDKPPNFSETSGNLTLKGPSVNELAGFMGLEYEFLERNYDGSFLFKGTGQELILDSLEITVGESDLSGWGSLQNTQPPTFELELKSKVLYLPLIEPALIAKEQVAEQATQETSVFSSTELPTQWLTMAEGKLRYDVAEVWTSAKSTASFEVELQLLEGEFRIDEFDWEGESKGQLDLTLKRNHAELDLEMTIESSRLPIVWLFGGEATPSDNTAFHASFDTTGASVKSLMGNLNGAIIFNGGSGKVEAGSLAFLFGDFFHTVSRKIIDRGADSRTNLTCSGGGIQFDNGIARLKPGLVIRTDEVDLFASGEVDLLSEKLHLALITKPGTGIGISAVKVIAPRLTVKGTLAKPSFSVDSKSTAISTYAAFISGGASMLATGLWDRATRSKDPCHDLYKLALKEVQPDPMTRK